MSGIDLDGDFVPLSQDELRELRGTPESRFEDERDMEWLIRTVRERPQPFAACGDIEGALVERLSRMLLTLRGTGELWALNKLLMRICEQAKARA